MEINNKYDEEICRVFKQFPLQNLKTVQEQRSWCRVVTAELGKTVMNSDIKSRFITEDIYPPVYEVLKPNVKIDNFTILEVPTLVMSPLELCPNSEQWSHPLALYILSQLRHLKNMFHQQGAKDIWSSVKQYANVITLLLIDRDPKVTGSEYLWVDTDNIVKDFRTAANGIINKIITLGQFENLVVCKTTTYILLEGIHKGTICFGGDSYSNRITTSHDVDELNRICRALHINIVP